MATTEPEQQISLKLVVTKERNKVVFAEAKKDFVDVLISLLTLPLGTIVRLVREESNMQPIEVGSLTSLYRSVENPDKEFLSTDSFKQIILRPKNSMEHYCKSLKLKIDDTEPTEYFACKNLVNCRRKSSILISMFKNRRCTCGNMLEKPIYHESSSFFDGFVKDDDTFFITDDLKVVPNSLNAFFDLFKSCGIESASSVNKMTVTITKNQVSFIYKCYTAFGFRRFVCDYGKAYDLGGLIWTCDVYHLLFIIFTGSRSAKKLFELNNNSYRFVLEKPCIEKYGKAEFPPFDVNENDSFKINVKIVQRKSNGKIVFANGKKDFADFLLSLLTIPLGGVAHLMEGFSCMYKSILNLDQNYWTADNVKNKVVDPGLVPQFLVSNKLFPIFGSKYFCYTETYGARTDPYLTLRHGNSVVGFTDVDFVDPILNSKNIVKGPTMYMATDDLVVTPMTATSVISLLATMSIPFSDLEEKEFSIGIKEAVGILQASLTSKSALITALSHLLTQIKPEN